jgi:hypothetical protein
MAQDDRAPAPAHRVVDFDAVECRLRHGQPFLSSIGWRSEARRPGTA